MSRAIHNLIKTEYENRQKISRDSLLIRSQSVLARIPEMEEVDRDIQRAGIRYNKLILSGGSKDSVLVENLSFELNKLKNQKEALLLRNGFSEDYLEPVYQCMLCKDSGLIDQEGLLEKCGCYRQQYIQHLYVQSNLQLVQTENFSTFDENYFSELVDMKKYGVPQSPLENIRNIKERCQSFISSFDRPEEKNLFFSGPAGVGKTFMSSCIAFEIIKQGYTVLYQSAPVLFSIISRYKSQPGIDEGIEDEMYKKIFEVNLLIIDDLGTESKSEARYAELLTILNTRQGNNLHRPCKTIISTNYSAKKLTELYTERVTSRIVGHFERLMFVGEDIRLAKA